MITIEGQKFEGLNDLKLPPVLEDAVLRKCWFVACCYGMGAKSPAERRLIRNVQLIDCKATNNSWLGTSIVEDVEIQGLGTGGVCFAWGAAFKHVRIRGRCGTFVLSHLPTATHSPEKRHQFEQANKEFYRDVDWALDISEGEFAELDIRSVPSDLIRRDPETQVIVRLEKAKAMQDVWRNLDLAGTPWAIAIDNMLMWGLKDTVLVAAKRRKAFPLWLAGLRRLQEAGVAEPD